ncbi:hypothetical protein ACGFJ4_25545, partial [Micromonospora chalcea]|uniref:hypothetical protein n=1 Tax=Micromonospora chalcea TaxID=1874 RepID=UPI00371AC77B
LGHDPRHGHPPGPTHETGPGNPHLSRNLKHSLNQDPQTASDLLNKAIVLDRYNEALYTKAMHARHALGDADGIRTLLRALTRVLADLDAQPSEDTIALGRVLSIMGAR